MEKPNKIGSSIIRPNATAENTKKAHIKLTKTDVLNITKLINNKNNAAGITDNKPNMYTPNLNS